jgi:hypothetical protein
VPNPHTTHGIGSQSSLVGIETSLQAGRSGVCILVGAGLLCSKRPDRLWGPPRLSVNWFRGSSRRYSGRDLKFPTLLHLVSGLRMNGAVHLLPLMSLRRGQGNLQLLRMESVYVLKLSFLRDFRVSQLRCPRFRAHGKSLRVCCYTVGGVSKGL